MCNVVHVQSTETIITFKCIMLHVCVLCGAGLYSGFDALEAVSLSLACGE